MQESDMLSKEKSAFLWHSLPIPQSSALKNGTPGLALPPASSVPGARALRDSDQDACLQKLEAAASAASREPLLRQEKTDPETEDN